MYSGARRGLCNLVKVSSLAIKKHTPFLTISFIFDNFLYEIRRIPVSQQKKIMFDIHK